MPEVVEKVAEIVRPFLKDPKAEHKLVAQVIEVAESFSGPLPIPQHFREYEEISPGAAKLIIDMARNEQIHRHQVEIKKQITHTLEL